MHDEGGLVDFDFTLALNNATGKYFVCQDAIEGCSDLIRNVWYWRLPLKRLPPRAVAKVLGRLALLELNFRLECRCSRFLPLMRNPRPLVFSDPREVILYDLKGCDVVLSHDMGPLTHPDLYHPMVKFTTKRRSIKFTRPNPQWFSSLTKFVTLYGDDYPSMKLIYPALRGEVESGPEEPIAPAPQRFLLTVGSVGSRKNHIRSLHAFARSKLADEGYCYLRRSGTRI